MNTQEISYGGILLGLILAFTGASMLYSCEHTPTLDGVGVIQSGVAQ